MHSCHHLTLAKKNPVAQIPETRKRKPGKTQKEIRKISAPAPCSAAPPAPGYTPVLSLCPAEAGLAEKVAAATLGCPGHAGRCGRHRPARARAGDIARCPPAVLTCLWRTAWGRRQARCPRCGPRAGQRAQTQRPQSSQNSSSGRPACTPHTRAAGAGARSHGCPCAMAAAAPDARQAGGRGAGGRAVPSARPAKMPRCARWWLRVGRREAHRPQARRRAAARALPVALRKGRAAERGRAASAPDGPAPNGRCGGLSPDSAVGAEQYMLARTAAGSRCAWGAAVPWELHGRAAAFAWYPSWKIYYFVEFQLRR